MECFGPRGQGKEQSKSLNTKQPKQSNHNFKVAGSAVPARASALQLDRQLLGES